VALSSVSSVLTVHTVLLYITGCRLSRTCSSTRATYRSKHACRPATWQGSRLASHDLTTGSQPSSVSDT
jgi:hypothetical protein